MTQNANTYSTRTLTVQVDFFGVMGARLQQEIHDTRDKARRAFKDLTNLARLAGIIEVKAEVVLISIGSDHVGKRFFIFTLAHMPDAKGSDYPAGEITTDGPLEVGDDHR